MLDKWFSWKCVIVVPNISRYTKYIQKFKYFVDSFSSFVLKSYPGIIS